MECLLQKANTVNIKHHPPSFLSFTSELMSYGVAYSFGQCGSALPAVSPFKILPSLLRERRDVGENSAAAVAKTQVCYQHLSSSQGTGRVLWGQELQFSQTQHKQDVPSHRYIPCVISLPYSKVLVSHPVPHWSPGSSAQQLCQRALNPPTLCSKQPGPDCTHPHILQQASLPVTQSIHLLPNSSRLEHRGNEAVKVMRLEEHYAMQNPFWCQLIKAETPLLLLHSPTVKMAVLEQSNFSVNLNSLVFPALSLFPSVPDNHKEVWCMRRWKEMEEQESWSAEAAWENLFKQASTHCKESSPVQNSLSPDLG